MLGKGSFFAVYEGRSVNDEKVVAIKKVPLLPGKDKHKKGTQESEPTSVRDHRNVTGYIEEIATGPYLFVIAEKSERSVKDLLEEQETVKKQPITNGTIPRITAGYEVRY